MAKNTYSVAVITDALKKHGPMTLPQIAKVLGCKVERSHQLVSRHRKRVPGERFCIVDYMPRAGGVGADVAVYAAHGGEDLPRPAHVSRKKIPLAAPPRQVTHAYLPEAEKIVIPVDRRPLCNSTTTGRYTGQELSYRGQA